MAHTYADAPSSTLKPSPAPTGVGGRVDEENGVQDPETPGESTGEMDCGGGEVSDCLVQLGLNFIIIQISKPLDKDIFDAYLHKS